MAYAVTVLTILPGFYEIQSGLAKARSAPGTENPSAVEDFDVAYELNRKGL